MTTQCQCSSGCHRQIIPGKPFCNIHLLKGCGRQSPLSGSEPNYDPDKYNKEKSIRHSHNCFAYAFSVIDNEQIKKCVNSENCNVPFHRPGKKANYPVRNSKKGQTCADTVARTLADSDGGYRIGFTGRCRRGFSKIAAVVDPAADFHYYRQDKTSFWSHKPGAMPVTNKDSVGNPIYDPALAGRYYPAEKEGGHELNYNGFCGYYCIPRNKNLVIASGGTRKSKRWMFSRTRRSSAAHVSLSTRKRKYLARKTRQRKARSSRVR